MTQIVERPTHGGNIMSTLVERQDFIIQTLHADLHFGHPQRA